MQLLATGTWLAGSEAACGSSAAHQHAPEGSPVPFPQGTPRLWVLTGLKCWENHLSCRQKVNFVLLTGPGKAKTVATSSNIDWRPFSKSIKAVKPHSNETASFRDLLQISL